MSVTVARPQRSGRLAPTLVAMSLAAGILYPWLDAWGLTPAAATLLKGAGVALLALAAAVLARGLDGRLLAAVLAAGATGDMLLNLPGGFAAGAAAFAVGHAVAILLYWRNRRRPSAAWRWLGAGALLGLAVAGPMALLPPGIERTAVTVYAVFLCAMAGAALLARFPLAAAGALLFVVSDAMIGARLGGLAEGFAWGLGVWYLYYFGQLLIFTGVRRGLDTDAASASRRSGP